MKAYEIYKKIVITFCSLAIFWAFVEFSDIFFNCTDTCGMEFIFIVPAILVSLTILGVWKLLLKKTSFRETTGANTATQGKKSGILPIIITVLVVALLFAHFVIGIF